MKRKAERDTEKDYPLTDFVAKLRRLAELLNAELERPDPDPVDVAAGEVGNPAERNAGTSASNH